MLGATDDDTSFHEEGFWERPPLQIYQQQVGAQFIVYAIYLWLTRSKGSTFGKSPNPFFALHIAWSTFHPAALVPILAWQVTPHFLKLHIFTSSLAFVLLDRDAISLVLLVLAVYSANAFKGKWPQRAQFLLLMTSLHVPHLMWTTLRTLYRGASRTPAST